MSGPVETFEEAIAIALDHLTRTSPLSRKDQTWAAFPSGEEDEHYYAVHCNDARFIAGDDRFMLTGTSVILVDKSTGAIEELWYANPTDRARLDAMVPVL